MKTEIIFSVMVAGAVLMMGVVTTIPQIVFAQPNNNNNGPCPTGYEIEKGKCVAPATETITERCPDIGPNGESVALIILNEQEYCTTGTTSSIILQGGQVTCRNPATEILNPIDPNAGCYVIVPMITETDISCGDVENAVLNTETNTCTVKPGNNRSA